MALGLAQWLPVAAGIHVPGTGDNSYIVVEDILPSVSSKKCRVVLGWHTHPIWDYKARHMAPFQTHLSQKLPCSPPMTSHSITLIAQSCLFSLHTSQHPCALPRQFPTAAGKLLHGVLELFGQEGENTNDYNHYFITRHHAEHPGTVQGYSRRAHRNCTPGRICLCFLCTASQDE